MFLKRALMVIVFAAAAGSVGTAVMVGGNAAGSPAPASPAVQTAPTTAIDAGALQPYTTLYLPTTIRLISQVTGAANLDKTHPVFSTALSKKSTGRLIATGSSACRASNLQQICNGAIAFRGGVMLVNQTLNVQTQQITGKVVGGSGAYAGAHGTVSGQNKGHGETFLTISYSIS